MAEISALTPSPPGLGDSHMAPPHSNSSDLHPHPKKATESSSQSTMPKSALYGDPAVMGPVWRGVKETAQDGKGRPPVPPKTAQVMPFLSAAAPLGADMGLAAPASPPALGGASMGSRMPESQTGPEPVCGETETHPSPSLNPAPDLQAGFSLKQASNAVAKQQDHAVIPPHSSASGDVLPPATVVQAQESSSQQHMPPHTLPPSVCTAPDTPTSPRTEPSFPVPIVHEPLHAFSLPNPCRSPALDTLSYLESASLMSGTMESLSGLGDDTSSLGSDSEVNGQVLRRTDKYGFLGGTQYTEGSEKEVKVDVSRQREMKWLEMFKNWDKWVSRRFQKVKLRCRKGIPSSLRSKAWQLLSNSSELLESNHGKFEELEREPGDPKWLDIIEKDLHRQFPFHEMFAARGGHGQQDLYRILKAYTVYRPDEGYCQAQAPVAAVLLMHMPAEQAFWCLVQICEKYLPGYYSAGLEAIQLDGEIFFSLLRRVCPMAYRHLKKFKIDPILYMTEWFMCIFSRTLPWACVLRVWDMFFCEGVKIVFRVGLVLLKQMLGSVEKLREVQGMYETMERLRNIPPECVREDLLVHEVMALPVTEALIERESTIQVRKWRESRGELTHQPRRRLHGTRVIYELKLRSAAISSGGSFSFLGGPEPLPGPLRASSSLLSLPGIRKPKPHFRMMGKKGSLTGELPQLPYQKPQWAQPASGYTAPTSSQPSAQSSSPTVVTTQGSAEAPAPKTAAVTEPAVTAQHDHHAVSSKSPAPPQTLMASPRVVSEHITPSLPSPAANNTPLPLAMDTARTQAPAEGAGEEEGKKKKRGKEEKKKEKEEEKQKAKERKEKEEEKQRAKERKEKEKQEKERLKKEKTEKKKVVKKKEKGGTGEEE